ncbi:MAG: HAMP domain-containing histidine kinase [Polyangiaceae bacterium]|nr:HAMP domain-containing histidine kinase [Polyangiaceae bacterium]
MPLVSLGPVLVVVIAVVAAVAIALIGVSQLATTSDLAASERASVLASALAARLRSTAQEGRIEVLDRAARRSAAELLLVDQTGQIVVNESFGSPSRDEVVRMLIEGHGETRTALGRVQYAAEPLKPPLSHLSVIAFVASPSPPLGSVRLANAVLALTLLLLALAVAVTLTFTRTARHDVDYVRQRIEEMARATDVGGPARGSIVQKVPIRSLDQVGVLTAAFNALGARFAEAEARYVADLSQASLLDKERTQFLAGLSHELRTPLNAILGFSHILESEVDGPLSEEAREHLAIVRTSGEHLRMLINDILDLSALENGKLELSIAPVEVRHLAEQVMREATAAARNKPLELSVSGDAGVYAFADRLRLRQILTNLVSNAVKFTERGSVAIRIEAHRQKVAISVIDTGPGVSKEDQAAIFEVYRQGSDARRRRGGAGLGLAITRRLVEMHSGTIALYSEVGHGSTFVVNIPRAEGVETGDRVSTETQRPSFFSVTDVRERARYAPMPEVRLPPPPKAPKSEGPEDSGESNA